MTSLVQVVLCLLVQFSKNIHALTIYFKKNPPKPKQINTNISKNLCSRHNVESKFKVWINTRESK